MKEFLLICIIVGMLCTEIWARPENSIDDLGEEIDDGDEC